MKISLSGDDASSATLRSSLHSTQSPRDRSFRGHISGSTKQGTIGGATIASGLAAQRPADAKRSSRLDFDSLSF